MSDENLTGVIEALEELINDASIPKNIKVKIGNITKTLQEDAETGVKINKALNILDEISDDSNIQPYVRTQLWNISSSLEMQGY